MGGYSGFAGVWVLANNSVCVCVCVCVLANFRASKGNA